MKRFALFITVFLLATSLSAQSECGTVQPPGYEPSVENSLTERGPESGGLIVVPIHIHLLRRSNGNSAITLQDAQTEIDTMNTYYADAGIIFVECVAAEIIDDDSLYYYDANAEENILLTNHYTQNVLNIYFAGTVTLSAAPLCGYSYFPIGPFPKDAAFIAAACATNGSTTAHEVGHYMGLLHTHGGNANELVDGSNCATDGDLICDTPADPNLQGWVDTACVYQGNAVDANNQPYVPDTRNIMSYSDRYCRRHFSPMQCSLMNSVALGYRSYLQCGPTSVSEPVAAEARVFPNPADNEIRVLFTNGAGENTVIEIIDATGRLVMTQTVNAGTSVEVLNTSGLPEGVYSCRVAGVTNSVFVIAR